MALTGITTDVSLEIITYLPLSSIASLLLVQKAWKNLVDSNAANIYRNAAALHRFIQKADTNLADAVAALDFDATPLDIHGWKEFCRLRLDIERNWAGLGPSEMWKLEAFGEQVHHWQSMNDSHTIVSSSFRGLSVFDAYETIWALPLDYLPAPTFFAYDQGYLAFLRPTLNTLEVWREVSDRPFPSKPSSAQKFAATSIVALYGPPDAGHFVPCYMLTCPEGEHISPGKSFKLHYPTLIATTRTRIHMWDVSVGKHLRTLDSKGMLDDHGISTSPRADICDDYVVTFDALQIRVFSRHDGNFLFHFSRKAGLSTYPRAMQLLPPRKGAALMQSQDAVFQKQVLFQKQHKWAYPRGNFNQVGLSPCGTILVALTENNRMIIIPEFQRVVTGEVEIADVAIEVKSGEEYGDLCGHPIVTRDRIAVGTEEGIIIFTIDRSKAGPVPKGSVRFTTPAGTRALPVQLSASCITLEWQGRDRNLSIGGTRLFFGAAPTVVLREPLLRFTRAKRRRPPPKPTADTAVEAELNLHQDDGSDDDGDSSMPDLESVSDSESGEEEDEESDYDDPPSPTEHAQGVPPLEAHEDGSSLNTDHNGENGSVPLIALNLNDLAVPPPAAPGPIPLQGHAAPALLHIAPPGMISQAFGIGNVAVGAQGALLQAVGPPADRRWAVFVVDVAPENPRDLARLHVG